MRISRKSWCLAAASCGYGLAVLAQSHDLRNRPDNRRRRTSGLPDNPAFWRSNDAAPQTALDDTATGRGNREWIRRRKMALRTGISSIIAAQDLRDRRSISRDLRPR